MAAERKREGRRIHDPVIDPYVKRFGVPRHEYYRQWWDGAVAQRFVEANFRTRTGEPLVARSWWPAFFEAAFEPDVDVVVVVAERQEGKTTALAALLKYLGLRFFDLRIQMVAKNLPQIQEIIVEKFVQPLAHESAEIQKLIVPRVKSNAIRFPTRRSKIELLSASAAGGVARSPNILVFEEAAHVLEEIFEQLIFGVRKSVPRRVIAASSSEVPEGWFYRLATAIRNEPGRYPRFRCIWPESTYDPVEPAREDVMYRDLHRAGVLSDTVVARSLGAEFAEDGDSYVPRALIEESINQTLASLDALPEDDHRAAFAFMDTSARTDISSSAVIQHLAPTDEDPRPKRMRPVRWSEFDPRDFGGAIPDDVLWDELELIVTKFRPIRLLVDCTSGSGETLVRRAEERGWWEVERWTFGASKTRSFYAPFQSVLSERRCPLPNDKRLIRELGNLRISRTQTGAYSVVDYKRKWHRDLAVSFIGAIYLMEDYLTSMTTEQSESQIMALFGKR